MGISSPVVIPAMLVVALLVVAVCFGTTATAAAATRPSHTDTDTTIRLPSSAAGQSWECCDWVTQDPTFRPPKWRCNDVVDKCSADCLECEASAAGDGFVCRDWIISLLEPPVCTPRPWGCCDLAACTRDYIPYCRCSDKVESCPSNCKECELVESDPPRYRCLDVFHGYPGPKCTPWVSKSN
ncbi:unnamed protein product [Miscanthus lutarioriparius]|uniref:Bowman-Birk serine protease inhibitors family domain-containing protein n=1 Tax=Miscanthus lutarioriparius TaxID=422564 RepID=A0A811QRW4_9POAL|nr:unnamed protein product [Miscanthus lutarioriparius]